MTPPLEGGHRWVLGAHWLGSFPWLYNANGEFTISPEATWYMTSRSALAWFISVEGCINVSYVYYEDDGSYLKPTFYLKERVLYKSGDGTKENPYRISINE